LSKLAIDGKNTRFSAKKQRNLHFLPLFLQGINRRNRMRAPAYDGLPTAGDDMTLPFFALK
jgi:hypothetical protein